MRAARVALQDPHHERDLEADQDADREHQRIERETERRRRCRLDREQLRRHQAADQTYERLIQEPRDKPAPQIPRRPRADPHREQIGANDGRELQDRVAEQIARERARGELVDEPARGDDEDRDEEGDRGRPDRRRRRERRLCGGAAIRHRITHPCTAAATIRPTAMHIEPRTIASATFFLSTISVQR